MLYNYENTSTELSLQPHAGNQKRDVIIGLVVAAVMLFFWLYPLFNSDITYIIIGVGAVIWIHILFDLLFQSKTKIIFDKQKRRVYKNYGGLFKIKLYDFSDVAILSTEECGGDYYGISHRKNRYGKNHAISNHFSKDESRQRFENEILPEITQCIKIPIIKAANE